MTKTIKDLTLLAAATLLISFLIWFPYLFKLHSFYNLDFSAGFATIYRNFDGLEYVITAKTFYNPLELAKLPQSLPAIYYASRFPVYPWLMIPPAQILGFLKSMLLVSLTFTIFSVWAFYFLVKDFKLTTQPLWLSLVFLLLPARWVIVHSVGSSEPVFIFFTLVTFYFLLKFETVKKSKFIWLATFAGILAQLTRSPGILIFASILIYVLWQSYLVLKNQSLKAAFLKILEYYPIILIPFSLIGLFLYFNYSYGNFWAYFQSGDNIHLTLPPFQVFDKNQFWVGEIWLEDIIYIFILQFLAGLMLFKRKLYPLAFFVLTFFAASSLIAHRDISRYTLPIFPFTLIAFEKVITSQEFKIVLVILALAIYLYTQNFIINNIAPYPNLEFFN